MRGLAFAALSSCAVKVVDNKADATEAAGAPTHVSISFVLSPLAHCTISSPSFEPRRDDDWLDEGVPRSCSLTASTVLVCIIINIIVSLCSYRLSLRCERTPVLVLGVKTCDVDELGKAVLEWNSDMFRFQLKAIQPPFPSVRKCENGQDLLHMEGRIPKILASEYDTSIGSQVIWQPFYVFGE